MDKDQSPPSQAPTDSKKSDSLPVDLNSPCKIINVSFEGVRKTNPYLLSKIVADVFKSKTLLDFLQRSSEAKEKLKKLSSFRNIELVLDPSESNLDDNSFEAKFIVEECGSVLGSVKTSVDDHTTHLDLGLVVPNLLGRGEELQFNSKFSKRIYSGELRFMIPILPWRHLWNPIFSFSCSKYQWGTLPSGYDLEDRSILNRLDFLSHPLLHHYVDFENVWRHIKSSDPFNTPIEIREQSGHSLKSSIKHTMTWNSLVGTNFPSEGILAKLSNEFTTNLVNNGVKFTRHEASLQYNMLIVPEYDILLQVNLLSGTLFKPTRISICDKFFAGGPLTVRSFKYQGMGSNRNGHPLGDMSYLAAGIHLYSILPYTSPSTPINDFIRPHIFFNTGTIGDIHDISRISSMDDIKRFANRFKDSLRYSCGFGLTMYFMRLRLEVNYCLPLVVKEQDVATRGLQYGFGVTYT